MTPEQYAKLLTDNDLDGKAWSEIPTDILRQILRFYEKERGDYAVRIEPIKEELAQRGRRE